MTSHVHHYSPAGVGLIALGLCLTSMLPTMHSSTPDKNSQEPRLDRVAASCADHAAWAHLDCSGHTRAGVASFYADRFGGRTMANGRPMRLNGDNAASRTLPLGTTAIVTNLETGRSARITIQDRGPYVAHRIVDLSPGIARKIGLSARQGLAHVAVAPLTVPMPDGSVRLGEASRSRPRQFASN